MLVFDEQLRKRRQAATSRARREPSAEGSAPARINPERSPASAPARVNEAGSRQSAPARMNDNVARGPAPERIDETDAVTQRFAPARVDDTVSQRSAPARMNGRYVPADVRRTVWQRDGARCTFEDASGRRCSERAGLEIHHEHAFALGGPPTVENLRLTCRAHNAFFAERDFGRDYMQSVVERA
jgi:hypothetical protein